MAETRIARIPVDGIVAPVDRTSEPSQSGNTAPPNAASTPGQNPPPPRTEGTVSDPDQYPKPSPGDVEVMSKGKP
jgi:hypothetical protein